MGLVLGKCTGQGMHDWSFHFVGSYTGAWCSDLPKWGSELSSVLWPGSALHLWRSYAIGSGLMALALSLWSCSIFHLLQDNNLVLIPLTPQAWHLKRYMGACPRQSLLLPVHLSLSVKDSSVQRTESQYLLSYPWWFCQIDTEQCPHGGSVFLKFI